MRAFSFVKETITDAIRTVTSRDRLRDTFGVSLYRNSLYLVLFFVVNNLAGVVFVSMSWRWYGKEDTGLAVAAISAGTLIGLVSSLGFNYGLIRYLPDAGDRAKDMINTCLAVVGVLSVAFASVYLLVSVWDSELSFLRDSGLHFAGFVLFTAAYALQYYFALFAFMAERRSGFVVAQGIVFGVFRFVPLFLMRSGSHPFGVLSAWGIGAMLAAFSGVVLFLPRVRPGYRPIPTLKLDLIRKMARYSVANSVGELTLTASMFLLPLIVVEYLGGNSNADFFVGWSVGAVLFFIPGSVAYALFAEGSHHKESLAEDVRRSVKLILLLMVPATLLVSVLADRVLMVIGPDHSDDATRLVWILAASALPVSINHIYFGAKRVEMDMRPVVVTTVFTAAATLVLSVALLPEIGILGPGIAWLVSQGLVSVYAAGRLVKFWKPVAHEVSQ